MKQNKSNLVVQHNKIIEARYKLSIGEQRLIKLLVSMLNPTDDNFKSYKISVLDLAEILSIKRKDFYADVRKATEKLIGNVLTINDDGKIIQSSWLSSALYYTDYGYVELQFSPLLKPFLLQLKNHFTAYELDNVIHLKHIYSIRIYELLKQYQKLGKRRFLIEELRSILKIDDDEYKQFKDFKRWVLLPSQKELQEKTDISFMWNEERKSQICVAVEFIITCQNRPKEQVSQSAVEILSIPQNNSSLNATINQLMKIGLSKVSAEQIVKDYDEARIKSAIAYTEAQQKEGKVKNPAGFLVKAIEDEYRDNQLEEHDRKEKEKKVREDKEKQKKSLKEKADELRRQAIDGFIASLTETQFAELQAEFIDRNKNNLLLMKSFNKNGMESALVKGCFRDFICKQKLSG